MPALLPRSSMESLRACIPGSSPGRGYTSHRQPMEFLLTIKVDIPDHIADTMPTAPDLQSEFQGVVDRAVAAAVERWAGLKSEDDILDITVDFEMPSKDSLN